jgi:hypothetical protein
VKCELNVVQSSREYLFLVLDAVGIALLPIAVILSAAARRSLAKIVVTCIATGTRLSPRQAFSSSFWQCCIAVANRSVVFTVIGSMLSNLRKHLAAAADGNFADLINLAVLVLGMCFFAGGTRFSEQGFGVGACVERACLSVTHPRSQVPHSSTHPC